MGKQFLTRALVFWLLVVICVAARWLPHPPNFTPLAAGALFAAYVFRHRAVAACIPLAALVVSDSLIGTYDVRLMAVVYAAAAFPVLLRVFLEGRWVVARAAMCAAVSSVIFFVSTNAAVWMFGTLYPHTPEGLFRCYAAALPFFQYTLSGDLFWSGALFGGYAWATRFGSCQAPGIHEGAVGRSSPRPVRWKSGSPPRTATA